MPQNRAASAAATEEKILTEASRLFADKGFAATSTEEIAAAAGVSKGAVFYRFSSKASLYETLLRQLGQNLIAILAEGQGEKRGWDALSGVAETLARSVANNPAAAQILLGELNRSERPWFATVREIRGRVLAPFKEIITEISEDRVAAGLSTAVPPDNQLDTAAVAALSAISLAMLDREAHTPDRPIEDVVAGLLMTIAGLRLDAPTP